MFYKFLLLCVQVDCDCTCSISLMYWYLTGDAPRLVPLWFSDSFLFQPYCTTYVIAAAAVILTLKCGDNESEKCFIARYPFDKQSSKILANCLCLGFFYARQPNVYCFLIKNGFAHLLLQQALGAVLRLEGAALTHGALFFLGGLGLLLSRSRGWAQYLFFGSQH